MQTKDPLQEEIPRDILDEAVELARGSEVLPGGVRGLAARLRQVRTAGGVLRVKLGVDPTTSDLHLGHTVVLRRLRRFQEMGHQAILIVGGFTAQIGDPTGRNTARPPLTADKVSANAGTYLDQVSSILDLSRAEVVNNTAWLAPMTLNEIIRLAGLVTVNQLIAKEGFGERLEAGRPVALSELFYPLLQAFDSVFVRADVEIGGTDQRFNILQGRELQARSGQQPQLAMLLPLLEGTDGNRKMSKSFGNAIGLKESPDTIFGKSMRLPDDLILKFFELATSAPGSEIDEVKASLAAGNNPRDIKEGLAHRIVLECHGASAAEAALAEWRRVHSERQAPQEMPSHLVASPVALFRLLVEASLTPSGSKARKLIEGGGVRLDGQKVQDPNFQVPVPPASGVVLQVGRRQFVRVVAPESKAQAK